MFRVDLGPIQWLYTLHTYLTGGLPGAWTAWLLIW